MRHANAGEKWFVRINGRDREVLVPRYKDLNTRIPTAEQAQVVARVLELARQASSQPVLDLRTPEQVLGYDDHGIPV